SRQRINRLMKEEELACKTKRRFKATTDSRHNKPVVDKHDDRRNNWIQELDKRRGKNISAVAVANKNARIAWAVLTKKEPYKAAA
nr:hypothetical protein [Endozoicomonas sp.]